MHELFFFKILLLAKQLNLFWSSIFSCSISSCLAVIQKVPNNVLSLMFFWYRTLLPHLHQKRISKVFCIKDASRTNPIIKVTKSCHTIELPILIFFRIPSVVFIVLLYINLHLTCIGHWKRNDFVLKPELSLTASNNITSFFYYWRNNCQWYLNALNLVFHG